MPATSKPSGVVERLAILAKLGKHEGGINRALATPAERAAREHFVAWAQQAGLEVTQDGVGNLFARRNGIIANAKPILVGSHLDTVPTGGAYDGAYGVLGALCALDLLNARNTVTQHPVEAVAWVGEEGSRFALGCLGSSTFCNLTAQIDVLNLVDENGITLKDALAGADGLIPDLPHRRESAVAAYLELHVEQGPVLEDANVQIGVVTAIAAQRRYRVTVQGKSGHAGTVPMDRRSDALSAASEMFLAIELAARSFDDCVATVGRVVVEPGGTNVIPLRVVFSLDVRSPDETRIEQVERALQKAFEQAHQQRGVSGAVETLETRAAAPMNEKLREAIRRAARGHAESMDVASGAGHDAMCLARVAPAAMIFVPSIGGLSHVGEERTHPDDLQTGVRTLADAIIEVDRTL
ncbi:MAG: Zn-dependent hydrolase [Candidatus Baltobacteraceae bacterium]